MVTLSSQARVLDAVRSARDVVASAYLLAPGPMLAALCDAAQHGTRVTVVLEGLPYGERSGALRETNARAVSALRRAGAHAMLKHSRSGGMSVHMKAVVCDRVAYLEDRNFPAGGRGIVLRDDGRAAVGAVRTAASGHAAAPTRAVATTKAQALAVEARVLRSAGSRDRVDVQTETLGYSGVYAALRDRALAGSHCRLLVSRAQHDARSAAVIAALKAAGVRVRYSAANEKLAVAGGRAWAGSANATSPHYNGDESDWGICSSSPAIAQALEARFESNWRSASRA